MEHHSCNSGGCNTSLQQDDQQQRDYEELVAINHRQEKRVHHHVNRAQNLTIGYLTVLGIYMLPISYYRSSTTSSLQYYCKNWWVPFAVSLSTSVIYFITFLDVVNKFYWTQYYLEVNRIDQQNLKSIIRQAKDHESKGHSKVRTLCRQGEPDPVLLVKRKLYICFTVSALIAISLLQLYACRLFSC